MREINGQEIFFCFIWLSTSPALTILIFLLFTTKTNLFQALLLTYYVESAFVPPFPGTLSGPSALHFQQKAYKDYLDDLKDVQEAEFDVQQARFAFNQAQQYLKSVGSNYFPQLEYFKLLEEIKDLAVDKFKLQQAKELWELYATHQNHAENPLNTAPAVNLNTAPVVNPHNTAPAVSPHNTALTVNPHNNAPAVNPINTAPAVNSHDNAPAVNPQNTAPAVNSHDNAPAVNPHNNASSVNPHDNAPAVNPHNTAPAVNPRKTTPAVNPHNTAPAVNPHKTTPAVNPHNTAVNPQSASVNNILTNPIVQLNKQHALKEYFDDLQDVQEAKQEVTQARIEFVTALQIWQSTRIGPFPIQNYQKLQKKILKFSEEMDELNYSRQYFNYLNQQINA